MTPSGKNVLSEVVRKHEAEILGDWILEQMSAISRRSDLLSEADLRQESAQFLSRFRAVAHLAANAGSGADIDGPDFAALRDFLADLSRSRALAGFSPSETANFVFSLKPALFRRLRSELGNDPEAMGEQMTTVSTLFDRLGLFTTEVHQRSREEVIRRQQEEMLELSTPVVKLWDGILALPIIGTLDSARTQTVMEGLLQKIVDTGSEVAIIDITGVPQVDTLVAQHLLKTVTAARLMGAECIISGIRPQIAQTIVHLGVNLGDIITKSSLADAFRVALARTGQAGAARAIATQAAAVATRMEPRTSPPALHGNA